MKNLIKPLFIAFSIKKSYYIISLSISTYLTVGMKKSLGLNTLYFSQVISKMSNSSIKKKLIEFIKKKIKELFTLKVGNSIVYCPGNLPTKNASEIRIYPPRFLHVNPLKATTLFLQNKIKKYKF